MLQQARLQRWPIYENTMRIILGNLQTLEEKVVLLINNKIN